MTASLLRRWRLAAMAGLTSGLIFAPVVAPTARARAGVSDLPAQYIAKLYTEGLGRAPDQAGWATASSAFDAQGCSVASLEGVGKAILESRELTDRWGTDPYALAEIAFRAVLNREPDPGRFASAVSAIRGRGWDGGLSDMFGGVEFGSLASQICSPAASSYGFNGSNGVVASGISGPVPACATCLPVKVPVGAANLTEGQLRLLVSIPGNVVALAPREVVTISQPLTLAPGVVLETYGLPDPKAYINMARLVRNFGADPLGLQNATVVLQGGSSLRNVWVSGQRAVWRNKVSQSTDGKSPTYVNANGQIQGGDDVLALGGSFTSVINSRLDDSPGASTLEFLGADAGDGCVANAAAGNLIEAYSSVHLASPLADEVTPWTDGISVHCQSTTVTMNQIVDATDAPVILFQDSHNSLFGFPPQTSQVNSNVIVSAGNSAYSALAADPWLNNTGPGDPNGSPGSEDFTGSLIGGLRRVPDGRNPNGPGEGNLFWSGPRTHFNAAISDGTTDFYGPIAYMGKGAKFINNTTGSGQANAAAGIVISGMLGTTVQGNTLNIALVPGTALPPRIWRCVAAEHLVEWDFPGRASGSVQGGPIAVQIPPTGSAPCIVAGT